MKNLQRSVSFGAFALLVIGAVAWVGSLQSCAAISALTNLSHLEFKIQDVAHVSLANVDMSNKYSISDFNVMDGLNLANAFRTGQFPLTFTLNVAARNPNPANATYSAVQLTQFPWKLMLDGHQTISGGIGAPLSIPNGGTTQILPLQATVDLKQFFADKGYNDIINLALSLSGQGGASHVQLLAQPTIGTPYGSFKYPNELTIVNTEFRS